MSHPARHRTLTRIGAGLCDRDSTLLQLVAESRFATTGQLARFLRAGHATDQSALRQTSRALKYFNEQHFVTALERRIGGKRSGSTGLVWALTPLGRRLLDTIGGRPPHRRYRPEEEPSPAFLEHTLAVTETHLILHELERAGRSLRLEHFKTEPASWRKYLGPAGMAATLKPDAYAVIGSDDYQDHYFLEIDRGTESLLVVQRKCLQYQAYRRSGLEQRSNGIFPAVLWVTNTRARAAAIRKRLAAESTIARELFDAVGIEDLPTRILAGPQPSTLQPFTPPPLPGIAAAHPGSQTPQHGEQ